MTLYLTIQCLDILIKILGVVLGFVDIASNMYIIHIYHSMGLISNVWMSTDKNIYKTTTTWRYTIYWMLYWDGINLFLNICMWYIINKSECPENNWHINKTHYNNDDVHILAFIIISTTFIFQQSYNIEDKHFCNSLVFNAMS